MYEILLDDEDAERIALYKLHISHDKWNNAYYVSIVVRPGHLIRLGKFLLDIQSSHVFVHLIDGNPFNFQRNNLRVETDQEMRERITALKGGYPRQVFQYSNPPREAVLPAVAQAFLSPVGPSDADFWCVVLEEPWQVSM